MREWLRHIRLSEGLTQLQVAMLIGMDHTSINKYELGIRDPSPKVAQKIAKKLNFDKYGYSWTNFFEQEGVK